MDNTTFSSFLFRQSNWVVDVAVCSLFGGWLGNTLQMETSYEREDLGSLLLLGTVAGALSFLLPGALGLPRGKKVGAPSWIWVVGIGSVLFVIGQGAFLVALKGVDPTGPGSATQQMLSLIFIPSMFGKLIKMFALFCPIFLFVLFLGRSVVFFAYKGYLFAKPRLR